LCLFLLASFALPGAAQSFEDAVAAFEREDYEKALSLFETLGAQGDVRAQHNAAYMHVSGLGTKRNFAKAMAWYRRAAEQGHAPSQYDLGVMYAEGEGVKPDPQTALMWYRRSAEQGFVRAQVQLAEIAFAGGNYAEAFFWWQKAAEAGDAGAMFNVGSAYYAGRGVAKDPAKAVEYYRKARDAGDENAGRILKQIGGDCVRAGDILTFEGTLSERGFHSAGGKPLRAIVLTLQSPICMRGEDDMEHVDDVRDIQLLTSDRTLEQKMRRLLGKRVYVQGSISPAFTAWYYSRILMNVSGLEPP
jgi:hypothetical protein